MAVLISLFIALVGIINLVLDLYIWVLIIGAVLSWLIAFDVINTRNRFVYTVGDFCNRLTEPALRRIRRFVSPINGIDISPIILILFIMFIQYFLRSLLMQLGT